MSVPIHTQLIPLGHVGRPGTKTGNKTSVTIHNTASPGATAKNEADFFCTGNTRKASAHSFVDDKEVYVTIPPNEVAWHCGNFIGNRSSYSIEVCEIPGRQWVADGNAAWYAAKVCRAFGLNPHNSGVIRTHRSWSGKYCPHLLIPRWAAFVKMVQESYDAQAHKVYRTMRKTLGARQHSRWLSLIVGKATRGDRLRVLLDASNGWSLVVLKSGRKGWVPTGALK